jgi:hypothetical protein
VNASAPEIWYGAIYSCPFKFIVVEKEASVQVPEPVPQYVEVPLDVNNCPAVPSVPLAAMARDPTFTVVEFTVKPVPTVIVFVAGATAITWVSCERFVVFVVILL